MNRAITHPELSTDVKDRFLEQLNSKAEDLTNDHSKHGSLDFQSLTSSLDAVVIVQHK